MTLEYLGEHQTRTPFAAPLYLAKVQAGFPSPADDYMDYVQLECKCRRKPLFGPVTVIAKPPEAAVRRSPLSHSRQVFTGQR
jgi:hypothetical protein